MKRIAIAVAAFIAPFAHASPELADQFGVKAQGLYIETVEVSGVLLRDTEAELSEAYVDELAVFAGTALKLGQWSDSQAGASDFGCIFRGMAEEADRQLFELEIARTPKAKSAALKRLIAMFDDAQSIAAAASHAARRVESEKNGSYVAAAPSCAANPADLEVFK